MFASEEGASGREPSLMGFCEARADGRRGVPLVELRFERREAGDDILRVLHQWRRALFVGVGLSEETISVKVDVVLRCSRGGAGRREESSFTERVNWARARASDASLKWSAKFPSVRISQTTQYPRLGTRASENEAVKL